MYIIVEHINLQDLVEDVNKLLEQDIEPLGGVSTNGKTYVQAMIGEPKEAVDINKIVVSRMHQEMGIMGPEVFVDYVYGDGKYSLVITDTIDTKDRQAVLMVCYEDAIRRGL